MAAGIATLSLLMKKGFYEKLEKKSVRLTAGLAQAAAQAGIPAQVDHVGSMLGLFFCADPVRRFNDAKTCDLQRFATFYQGMRAEGVYIAPSQFEALFLSAAHTDAHIDTTVTAAEKVLGRLLNSGIWRAAPSYTPGNEVSALVGVASRPRSNRGKMPLPQKNRPVPAGNESAQAILTEAAAPFLNAEPWLRQPG